MMKKILLFALLTSCTTILTPLEEGINRTKSHPFLITLDYRYGIFAISNMENVGHHFSLYKVDGTQDTSLYLRNEHIGGFGDKCWRLPILKGDKFLFVTSRETLEIIVENTMDPGFWEWGDREESFLIWFDDSVPVILYHSRWQHTIKVRLTTEKGILIDEREVKCYTSASFRPPGGVLPRRIEISMWEDNKWNWKGRVQLN